jgi:hypothetical protein
VEGDSELRPIEFLAGIETESSVNLSAHFRLEMHVVDVGVGDFAA